MAESSPTCPDCDARMVLGYLPEVLDHNMTGMTCWLEGPPDLKTFFGFNTGLIKVNWKEVIPVSTFRCPSCGLLRSYAVKPAEAP